MAPQDTAEPRNSSKKRAWSKNLLAADADETLPPMKKPRRSASAYAVRDNDVRDENEALEDEPAFSSSNTSKTPSILSSLASAAHGTVGWQMPTEIPDSEDERDARMARPPRKRKEEARLKDGVVDGDAKHQFEVKATPNKKIEASARGDPYSEDGPETRLAFSFRKRMQNATSPSDGVRGTEKRRSGVKAKSSKSFDKQAAANVDDVPDSEDELAHDPETTQAQSMQESVQKATAPKSSAKGKARVMGSSSTHQSGQKKRGRRTKQSMMEQSDAAEEPQAQLSPCNVTKSRGSKLSSAGPSSQKDGTTCREDGSQPPTSVAASLRGLKGQPRSIGIVKKDSSQSVSILTASGRAHKPRQRKGVASFGDAAKDGKSVEVFFADLPSSSNRLAKAPARKSKETAPVEEQAGQEALKNEEQKEHEDDEVCAICSGPNATSPNEMIFCGDCGKAVHQQCYGVAYVPEGDWLCRDCSSKEDQAPDIADFEQHLKSMQRVLLDRCTGLRRIKLLGQDEAYEKTLQVAQQTVAAGEGNSMLVIGARGCGKTTLVEAVLSELSKHHKHEFHVVRLNGFLHTDDKLALKEIWRQLGKEMEDEHGELNKTNNHADTMASLLAMLSHPSELDGAQDDVTSKAVIFVVDEFDLFATHARQLLLYNLFDIAQARKAPIAVLGLTTRIHVVESLEKRVKSRFSHRCVYMTLPKTLAAYWAVCKQGLTIDDADMKAEGIDAKARGHGQFCTWWNDKIKAVYKTAAFRDHLEFHYYSGKSVSAFLNTCILPLSNLTPARRLLKFTPSEASCRLYLAPPDSKLQLLESLSDLDLSMLIAAARLDIVAHTDTVNFAMVYDEYTSLMSRQRVLSASAGLLAAGGGMRVWGRGVAGIAWERLVALKFLLPAGIGARAGAAMKMSGGGLESKMWRMDVVLEEIPTAVRLNALLERWCKEI